MSASMQPTANSAIASVTTLLVILPFLGPLYRGVPPDLTKQLANIRNETSYNMHYVK